MTGIRSTRVSQRRLLADLEGVLRPPRRAGLPGFTWRWRYELGLAAAVITLITSAARTAGAVGAVVALSALAAAAGLFAVCPPCRAGLAARAWFVITPHRLRTGFVQARVQSRRGRLPVIVRTVRTPFGERVLVWCPAGTTGADLHRAREVLRSACWAADVVITQHPRRAHLVTVDVVRRGPWGRRDSVRPALAGGSRNGLPPPAPYPDAGTRWQPVSADPAPPGPPATGDPPLAGGAAANVRPATSPPPAALLSVR